MADCLVRLYNLTACVCALDAESAGYTVRRAMSYERTAVSQWVTERFGNRWASECSVAFSRSPVTCLLAINMGEVVGFACYEVTQKNFFGPVGICQQHRGKGVGRRLLLRALLAMKEMGYAYAIIGDGGHAFNFYAKTAGATLIEDSEPGIYADRLDYS